jgi:hypothetical protein
MCLLCIINIYKQFKCFNCPICRKAKKISKIKNVYFLQDIGLFNETIVFTPFNTDRHKSENNVKTNSKYIIVLPKKDILLLVVCEHKALLSADMKIIAIKKNDRFLCDSIDCTISYNYNNYNKIHFDSFFEYENCLIYTIN